MKLVSGIVDSGFFAQSALSAEVATKDSLGRNISETYLTGVDLTPYQTVEGMTAYQSAGEYYSASNPSGFLVADDITGKLDASVYATDSGTFLTAVPDTYLQNTDLSTEDGKVTAISGIPLSAGGDVPEGVMVESGLEYNAVNEISGYNGSAIAQYGAEKQWLVHDDTLVHAANSAQYALGVNLSAVAQLLGVDETVLWSGSANAASFPITLSEPASAFNEIKFIWTPRYQGDYGCPTVVEIQNTNPHNGTIKYTLMHAYWNANEPWLGAWYLQPTNNFTEIASEKNAFCSMTKTAQSMSDGLNCFMWEIRGIGRKQ